MNATVTRSATKSAAAKGAGKLATKAVVPPTAKTPAKTVQPSKETSGKTATTATKSKAASKSSEKEAVARKAGASVNTKPATETGNGKAKTILKPASKAVSKEVPPDAYMSGNNASAGLRDRIEKPVVSKVSEVATKTTKPTPDAPSKGTLLTEAAILQMSDKDYMNGAQLAFFKARLQQLEIDLLKNAGETTEHLRETVLVPDPADRATIEEEHALELRTRDRERKLLKKVQQSIASIDAGEYGWCEETGEPIGIPRLLARPTATLSLEAQQRRELKQKLYGD
ncbi:RNA polymerase-binding protein DksA [Noviherbaspirillum cavernae]|nr:RNA polymerase-binding protein DksA [Noviherbaspirillum cavernae]